MSSPTFTFHGPTPSNPTQIKALDPTTSAERSILDIQTSKKSFYIFKNGNLISHAKLCPKRGEFHLNVHEMDVEIKYKKTSAMPHYWVMHCEQLGVTSWEVKNSTECNDHDTIELIDESGDIIAKGSVKESKLEVYLVDEKLADLVLSSWMVVSRHKERAIAGALSFMKGTFVNWVVL